MLSLHLAILEGAGVKVDYTCESGVLTITVQGVAEAQDDEGVYFVPALVITETEDTRSANDKH